MSFDLNLGGNNSNGSCKEPGARAGRHPQEGYDDSNGAHLRQGPISTQGIGIIKAMEAALNNEDSETFSAEDRQFLKQS
jgi:hypothetical protein